MLSLRSLATRSRTHAVPSWTSSWYPKQSLRCHQPAALFSTSPAKHPQPASRSALSETFLDGTSAVYVEEMYSAWKSNPSSVHKSWDVFFRNSESGIAPGGAYMSPPTLHGGGATAPAPGSAAQQGTPSDYHLRVTDSMRLVLLVRAYQVRGHAIANLDPLGLDVREEPAELHPSRYGFSEADMDREIHVGDNLISGFLSSGRKTITLREIIKRLREAYCGSIGVEYMHIQEREQCDWIRERFETPSKHSISKDESLKILDRLGWADSFERFLNTKYKNLKRFGLDGCESLIPGMKALIDEAAERGVNSIVIGMPHRGRLNVLANVVRKPLPAIFNEFNGGVVTQEDEYSASGDVKYHLGTSYDRPTRSGKKVHLSLMANPSHLEAVNPLVEGKTRAKQFYANDDSRSQVMPIVLHGDAAFAGQGVVYETLHLSDLKNYTTGGTIHIIVNNQIGFTTDPKSSRSSQYCTDVAKTINAPIFHVNGDDPEAVVHVHQLAAEWRQTFKKDVVIDIVCYRRYGHNEVDQPHFTQPLMYQRIDKQVPIFKKYSEQLISSGVLSQEELQKMKETIQEVYENGYQEGMNYKPKARDWLESHWVGFKSPEQLARIRETGVNIDTLQRIGKALHSLPEGFTLHPTLRRIIKEKESMFTSGKGLDWATAEALAFGSLMLEGNHVRLSGQDVERGTFSHRHAVLHDQKDGSTYTPLTRLDAKQAGFTVTNSSLSEFAVLGFELGYSLENPNALVMWEAQFGDFCNGAQVIIDQFISSGEQKWMRQSGLVLLLPHGYDGAGPEHSSARLERFLQLCDSDPFTIPESLDKQFQKSNWQIINCTTTANYFHVLRRQIHREFRKPLVVFTPKWLLRYPQTFSALPEFTDSNQYPQFRRLIPEAAPENLVEAAKVTRLVFCSGQVYYLLLQARNDNAVKDVAIVRLEQLYPFPFDLVAEQAALYPNAEVWWCQEEPMNMGAWSFVSHHLVTAVSAVPAGTRTLPPAPRFAGRPVSASPAVASTKLHKRQQERFINRVFNLPEDHAPPAPSSTASSASTPPADSKRNY